MTTSGSNTIEDSIDGENSKTESEFRQHFKEKSVPIIAAVVIVSFALLAIYLFTRKQGDENLQETGAEPQLDETEKTLKTAKGLDIEAEK
jgi:Na+/H+ antiporter NhaC